ncbi:methylenetetrahydrofolate reductase [Rhodococcus pyridinivorans]
MPVLPDITPAPTGTEPGSAITSSRYEAGLRDGRFMVIAEVNGTDSADAATFTRAARKLSEIADIVSITDHSGANVHMGNVAASAHMRAAGIEVMTTFACRDRNRIALQGDLIGVASLGVENVLLVTGNHVDVGDSKDSAQPVFDLDGSRLIGLARDLRDLGRFENGREIDTAPKYLINAPVHPFSPPYDARPEQALRKVDAGADCLITQHIFDLPRWREFQKEIDHLRAGHRQFWMLGGVAVLPDEPTARRVNAGLRGFSIPEELFDRLRRAANPAKEGIKMAAELVSELAEHPGISGCLIAPVTVRSNLLDASTEQADILAAVLDEAGIDERRAAR